jgi:hypothetical protein
MKTARTILFILTMTFLSSLLLHAQDVTVPMSHYSIYEFLDEMAAAKIINTNSAIKPFSRMQVAVYLDTISHHGSTLSKRQKKDLEFFLLDYSKELNDSTLFDPFYKQLGKKLNPWGTAKSKRLDLIYYRDKLINMTINPILGLQYWANSNGNVYHRWWGAEAYLTIGKHFAMYTRLTDNHESQILAADSFFTQRTGAAYKINEGGHSGGDYSRILAGISYQWKWGSTGVKYDFLEWGNNYNGANILSGHSPAFAYIFLKIKPIRWLEFNYIHGFLNSMVLDSSRSYTYSPTMGYSQRNVYYNKYIAANMLTFTLWKQFNVSLGNSVIYSADNVRVAYLIPVMFYAAADEEISGSDNYAGDNSQFYIDLSSRNIKSLHLYATLFVDELSFSRMFDPDEQSNYISFKGGLRWYIPWVKSLYLTAEYTRTNPQVYKHPVPTLTFASNNYCMGNYLRDNSDEIYFGLGFRPLSRMHINLDYSFAQHGPDYEKDPDASRTGLPFMEYVIWQSQTFNMKIQYELYNDINILLGYQYSNISGNGMKTFTPEFYYDNTNTITFGLNWGW